MRSKDLFGSGHLRRHPAVLKLLLVLVLGAANPAASIGLLSAFKSFRDQEVVPTANEESSDLTAAAAVDHMPPANAEAAPITSLGNIDPAAADAVYDVTAKTSDKNITPSLVPLLGRISEMLRKTIDKTYLEVAQAVTAVEDADLLESSAASSIKTHDPVGVSSPNESYALEQTVSVPKADKKTMLHRFLRSTKRVQRSLYSTLTGTRIPCPADQLNSNFYSNSFGSTVSVSDTVMVIGRPGEFGVLNGGTTPPDVGSVHIYEKDSSDNWVEVQKIVNPFAEACQSSGDTTTAYRLCGHEYFGHSVSVTSSGNTIAVGTPNDGFGLGPRPEYLHPNSVNIGSVYLYEKQNGSWTQVAKITASDIPIRDGIPESIRFGVSVSVTDTILAVGASDHPFTHIAQGAAYIYERSSPVADWNQAVETKVWASDTVPSAYEYFGHAIAVSGDTVMIGAPSTGQHEGTPTDQGAAYIYEKENGSWTNKLIINDPDGDATNYYTYRLGQSMSIFGDVAIVSAIPHQTAGKAFVLERDNGVWSHVQTLQPSDGSSGDQFGHSVFLSESYIIVGAPAQDTSKGAAYVFERSPDDGIWVEVYKLIPTQTSTGIRFGNSVSLAGDQAVVGASGEFAENGNRNGAAYYFTLQSIASSNPSMTPSAVPSISFQPSPSNGLSSSPSGVPSFTPSDVPSLQPSAMPSDGPSSQPSDLPSCTPSESPTPSPSINLFYPDQSSNGLESGCLNDGAQPAWMEQNPSFWLSSTLDKCCTQHFGWNYDHCMGVSDDTCARAYWYPDWEGSNEGCVRNGDEPLYMRQNPAQYFFNTKADCCEEHYDWNQSKCMGTAASTNTGTGRYYPDWLGDDTCKNDGSAPEYMTLNPTMWLHDNLSDCCKANYAWKMNDCMGTAATVSTGKFYPDWSGSNEGCLNDGGEPQYMVANPSMWMYDTLDECCEKHYKYNEAGCKGTSTSGTEGWYVVWGNPAVCVKNCVQGTGTGCGGLAESWDIKYESQSKCCSTRVSFAYKECMA